MTAAYHADAPTLSQNDLWSCAPTSARWALTALGRQPAESWIEATMLAEKVVSQEHGLLDATGTGLAAFIRRHYSEFGYDANHEPSISWEWIVHEGAANPDGSGHQYPVLIGGRAWGHWTGVKDYHPAAKVLLLANPANSWKGVGQTMSRTQFDALGPFSAVRIWHLDLFPAEPPSPAPIPETPPLPPAPPKMTVEQLREGIRDILGRSDQDHAPRSIRRDLDDLYTRSE